MKKLFKIVLASLAVAILAAGCGSNGGSNEQNNEGGSNIYRSLEDIKKSGSIKIGVFSDKNPFGYIDETGAYKGYDVTFADRLAKDLGVEAEYVSTEPANRVEYLKSGKVDLILANFTVTEERKEAVDFALPYMKVSLGIVSPDNALITSPEQLNGKKLIVAKGTTAETYFTQNYPEVELVKFDQYTETFNALIDGRGDALSTDNTEVLAWALQNDGFSVGVDSLGEIDTIAPAVAKGNKELLDWINKEIKKIGEEQFFHKNYEENLAPVYGDTVSPDSIVVESGIVE